METILMNIAILFLFVLSAVVVFFIPTTVVFAMGSWYMIYMGFAGYFFLSEGWWFVVLLIGFYVDIVLWQDVRDLNL
jgi:hypothetical protein